MTAWAAAGARRSEEANSLANITVNNGSTGAATAYRFDNTREDSVNTGELGVRGKLQTGSVGHEWVASASLFDFEKKNAYAMDSRNTLATNLYGPVSTNLPAFSGTTLYGGDLANPLRTGTTRLTSFAVGDTRALLQSRIHISEPTRPY